MKKLSLDAEVRVTRMRRSRKTVAGARAIRAALKVSTVWLKANSEGEIIMMHKFSEKSLQSIYTTVTAGANYSHG